MVEFERCLRNLQKKWACRGEESSLLYIPVDMFQNMSIARVRQLEYATCVTDPRLSYPMRAACYLMSCIQYISSPVIAKICATYA